MRICRVCQIEKPIEEFPAYKSRGIDRIRSECRECRNAKAMEKYYEKLEESREYVRKRYDSSKAKEYYKTNHKRLTEMRKRYRESLDYRVRSMFNGARNRAAKAGMPFDITIDFLEKKMQNGVCEKSGIPFDFTKPENGEQRNKFSPSIDKIDRLKGYTKDNVQLVVWCYNTGKGEMTNEEFIVFCKKVADYNHDTHIRIRQ